MVTAFIGGTLCHDPQHPESYRQHPAGGDPAAESQPACPHTGQAGVPQPRRFDQGPSGVVHDRGRGTLGWTDTGKNGDRGHQRQHGDWPGHGLLGQGLPAAAGHERGGQCGAAADSQGARCGDSAYARSSGHRRCHRGGIPPCTGESRRLFHDRPVQQPGQLDGSLQRNGCRVMGSDRWRA